MRICGFCSAPCCKEKLITITAFDALKIKKATSLGIKSFAELALPRILNIDQESLFLCREKGERFSVEYVLALKSRPCIFLEEKNSSCKIYENAPMACRLYPFSESNGLIKGPRCPFVSKILFSLRGVANQSLLLNSKKENSIHKKIAAKWNKIQGSKNSCLAFIEKEAKKFLG